MCTHGLSSKVIISWCTRPPTKQFGDIFCHLNDHCVLIESARQFGEKNPEKYEKYASDSAFGASMAKNLPIYLFST